MQCEPPGRLTSSPQTCHDIRACWLAQRASSIPSTPSRVPLPSRDFDAILDQVQEHPLQWNAIAYSRLVSDGQRGAQRNSCRRNITCTKGRATGLIAPRIRTGYARLLGRLRGLAQLSLQIGDPSPQGGDLHHQPGDRRGRWPPHAFFRSNRSTSDENRIHRTLC